MKIKPSLATVVALFFMVVLTSTSLGQLPRDVRDMFQGMLSDLEPDLQEKFEDAIKNDTAKIEFSIEQFKRFRNNPINPFDGLDAIEPDQGLERIALVFELPSLRERDFSPFERQNPNVRRRVRSPVLSASQSTVSIYEGGLQVALGTVVQADGLILTKASEVNTRESLRCVLSDGRSFEAKIVSSDKSNDLAVLKIETSRLPVIQWSDSKILAGSFVLTPAPDGEVLALGTYSVAPRSTAFGKQAFLGVQPETTSQGVRVSAIEPGAASHAAGLENGDTVTQIDGNSIVDVPSLVKAIRDRSPGDKIDITFRRNGSLQSTTAILAGQNHSGLQAARFKMMNKLGAIPSQRDDNFPSVFQHDSPIFPEQCGGPITDLEGNVLGINIARKGRAATYAIPSSHVRTILKELLRKRAATP